MRDPSHRPPAINVRLSGTAIQEWTAGIAGKGSMRQIKKRRLPREGQAAFAIGKTTCRENQNRNFSANWISRAMLCVPKILPKFGLQVAMGSQKLES